MKLVRYLYLAIKLDVHILPKTAGVVIFHRFCISKGLKTDLMNA